MRDEEVEKEVSLLTHCRHFVYENRVKSSKSLQVQSLSLFEPSQESSSEVHIFLHVPRVKLVVLQEYLLFKFFVIITLNRPGLLILMDPNPHELLQSWRSCKVDPFNTQFFMRHLLCLAYFDEFVILVYYFMDGVLFSQAFVQVLPGGERTQQYFWQRDNIFQLSLLHSKQPIQIKNFKLLSITIGFNPTNFFWQYALALEFGLESVSISKWAVPSILPGTGLLPLYSFSQQLHTPLIFPTPVDELMVFIMVQTGYS